MAHETRNVSTVFINWNLLYSWEIVYKAAKIKNSYSFTNIRNSHNNANSRIGVYNSWNSRRNTKIGNSHSMLTLGTIILILIFGTVSNTNDRNSF